MSDRFGEGNIKAINLKIGGIESQGRVIDCGADNEFPRGLNTRPISITCGERGGTRLAYERCHRWLGATTSHHAANAQQPR
ncbi:MAG: hypothetical protein KF832_14595 [Caldilineaceae bacterium]|nr:hypothetical protein [Caldilineaceae bacterium]